MCKILTMCHSSHWSAFSWICLCATAVCLLVVCAFGVGVLQQSSVSLTIDSNVKTIYISTQLVETNNVKTFNMAWGKSCKNHNDTHHVHVN